MGKPAPAGDGRIRINFAALLTQPLPPGTIYTASVSAVGPGGRTSSTVAPDTFIFTAPLQLHGLARESALARGQWGQCERHGDDDQRLRVDGVRSSVLAHDHQRRQRHHHRNGELYRHGEYDDEPAKRNADGRWAVRHGHAGRSAVQLRGLARESAPLAASGASASVTVTTTSGCAWTASEAASWLTITSGGSGTTTGTVSYTATANTTTSPRSATLTVAGQSVTVAQDAAACSFTVSAANPPSLGGQWGQCERHGDDDQHLRVDVIRVRVLAHHHQRRQRHRQWNGYDSSHCQHHSLGSHNHAHGCRTKRSGDPARRDTRSPDERPHCARRVTTSSA